MNVTEILQLIGAIAATLPAVASAGMDIWQRIEQIKSLSEAAAAGTVTPEMVASARAALDADLAELNSDMPPA